MIQAQEMCGLSTCFHKHGLPWKKILDIMWKNAVKSAEFAHSITLNCSAIMVIPGPRKLKYMMKTQSKDIHCCATEDTAYHV